MTEELNAIKAALRALPGMAAVYSEWPKSFSTTPCAIVQLAGETPAGYRDDAEYLTQREWYVRVFGHKQTALLTLCESVYAAMAGLGYERTFRWDESDADICQVAFRFVKTT